MLLAVITIQGAAQNSITFIITQTPPYTPKNDTLYLSSSLDNWSESNISKQFKLYPDGLYRLTVDLRNTHTFQYKINRGNWNKVEGNNWGDYMPNRIFSYNDSIFEVRITVDSWQDLHHTQYPPIDILVTSVPRNTPHDASIYLTGTFNNWIDNDLNYRLTKQDDGTYIGRIPAGYDSISFKFIRGSWESIEARWDGGMLSNRTFVASLANTNKITAVIQGWQDLTPKLLWLKTLFLIFLFQSLLITSVLLRHLNNKLLAFLCVLISLAFFFKFCWLNYNWLSIYPKTYFTPSIIYGFILAIGYAGLRREITQEKIRFKFIYILPLLPALWHLQYLFIPSKTYFLKIVTNEFSNMFLGYYGYAILLHLIFSYKLKSLFHASKYKVSEYTHKFYMTYLFICPISVIIIGIEIVSIPQNMDIKIITDWNENLIWLYVGILIVYHQWFYLIKKNSYNAKNNLITEKDLSSGNENWMKYKNKLTHLMEEKKVYLNPELTLSDLAEHLGTNNQYISRLINEEFKKSYTDFINDYRINTFIETVKNDDGNNTFLYHAYKVGFNSKSAFNRSFKKKLNTTPSDFFAKQKVQENISK